MNITEAHAVDKVLTALARHTQGQDYDLTAAEDQAVEQLRERAAKPLLVSPDAIGRAST